MPNINSTFLLIQKAKHRFGNQSMVARFRSCYLTALPYHIWHQLDTQIYKVFQLEEWRKNKIQVGKLLQN